MDPEWENRAASRRQDPPGRSYISVKDYSFWFGHTQVLQDLNLDMQKGSVTAFIGPSGCGKSTLLRSFNRLNELDPQARHRGDITIEDLSIYDPAVEVISLRKRVGMVFQKSNPFPKSIYENVVYSLRVAGKNNKSILDEVAENSLRSAALWDEVKDRLGESAYSLSVGQMQRLCIARAIANEPEVILMDEPCSALDPIATAKIEELIHDLKIKYTIIIVTHNMQQAARVSDSTAFFYTGNLIEYNKTQEIFLNPQNDKTEAYVSGRSG
ncbi:MAG: phosphate ABC transporter ATP-binding protein [Opitutae bacterium]|nr:phosphate ABC transporter ATP-binding protein [Opitutae bacterium]